jgi:hypothetical protein
MREIVGHDVSTVQREGWAGMSNGKLLRAASKLSLPPTRIWSSSRIFDRARCAFLSFTPPATQSTTFGHWFRVYSTRFQSPTLGTRSMCTHNDSLNRTAEWHRGSIRGVVVAAGYFGR